MIITYVKENLENDINVEVKLLDTFISNYEVKSKTLARHIKSNNPSNSYSHYNLEDYSIKLEEYLNSLKNLKNSLFEILDIYKQDSSNPQIDEKITFYNNQYNKLERENVSLLFKVDTFVYSSLKSYKSNLNISTYKLVSNNLKKPKIEEISLDEKQLDNNETVQEVSTESEIINTQDVISEETPPEIPTKISDNNTLIISEIQNKVFLPYTVQELENILNKSKKYNSYGEIISDLYILPMDKYRFSNKSRFKETYYLMRKKEKASIIDSLNVALEQTFNGSLNPAVIAACKNLDELDIYLDCLDTNETDKFPCFTIKYEIPPKK